MATAKTPKSTPAASKPQAKQVEKPAAIPAAKPTQRGPSSDGPARFYGDDNPSPNMEPRPESAGGRSSATRSAKPAGAAKAAKPAAKPKSSAVGKGATTSAPRSSKSKPSA